MTIQQLNYLIMISDTGSISEAAKRLYISQPTLTSSLRKLESELSISIFTRTSRGVFLTEEGKQFLAYARQILDQVNLVESKYKQTECQRPHFSVSCQHYAFAVNAFVDLIRLYDAPQYDFTIRETTTFEVIEDVSRLRSEVGILYINRGNEEVMNKLFKQYDLVFTPLFTAQPHVFISRRHPLADKEHLTLKDLEDYPCLTFDQGEHNSFYFSEEILYEVDHRKNIRVHDRATLFNLAKGLNGYTITSGVLGEDLNDEEVVTRPLYEDDYMQIGTVTQKALKLSRYAERYLTCLEKYIRGFNRSSSILPKMP